MRGIRGKVALVTGAGRGIGKATALRLTEEGTDVVLNDLEGDPLQATLREIKLKGANCIAVAGSVTDPQCAGQLVKAALDSFKDLHIVVTCAGFSRDVVFHRTTDEEWQAIIDVHLTGTFRVLREAFRYMRDRAKQEKEDRGTPMTRKLVTVSSRASRGNFGQTNYSAAKAGILGLTKSIALEGASFNIYCNAVSFGMIDTRMTQEKSPGSTGDASFGVPKEVRSAMLQRIPLGRPGTVEEAAGAIVFLASEDANFITGQELHVNGGARM